MELTPHLFPRIPQMMTRSLGDNTPAPCPTGGNLEVSALWSPKGPCHDPAQMPTEVICLVTHILLASFLSLPHCPTP